MDQYARRKQLTNRNRKVENINVRTKYIERRGKRKRSSNALSFVVIGGLIACIVLALVVSSLRHEREYAFTPEPNNPTPFEVNPSHSKPSKNPEEAVPQNSNITEEETPSSTPQKIPGILAKNDKLLTRASDTLEPNWEEVEWALAVVQYGKITKTLAIDKKRLLDDLQRLKSGNVREYLLHKAILTLDAISSSETPKP